MGFPKIYTPSNSILNHLLSPNKGKNKGKTFIEFPFSKQISSNSSENKRKQSVIVRFTDCFLAGALGLEPRAYGFGDEADKSASGGTSFEVNISTFQKQIAAAITKIDSKIKQIGNFINKPTVFWVYGLLCRNRRLRKYIIIR